jgi:hypothetical protein
MNTSSLQDPPRVEEAEAVDSAELLDVTVDDEQEKEPPAVGTVMNRLIKEARDHHSFAALFKLQAVKSYLELYEKYRTCPQIRNPRVRASSKVANSVGKGPYFAKKFRKLTIYISRFQTNSKLYRPQDPVNIMPMHLC